MTIEKCDSFHYSNHDRHCASVLSFALAAANVCHCMLLGASVPPHSSGFTWSMTYPGHRPTLLPVAGHGCCFLKLLIATLERLICPCLSRKQDVQRRAVCKALLPCGIKGRLQRIKNSRKAAFLISLGGEKMCLGATMASYSMPMSHRSLRAASEGTSQPQRCNLEP